MENTTVSSGHRCQETEIITRVAVNATKLFEQNQMARTIKSVKVDIQIQSFWKSLILVRALLTASGVVSGPAADHCGEIGFKYGCPLNNGSIHLDLSDIAMARLQTGDPNGNMVDGVIPTRYKRVSCPKPGNVFVWLRSGAGPYYFALTVVNAAGIGSVVDVQISADSANWTSLKRDPNYTSSRPQERYGSWVVPQGTGPFNPPVAMRIVYGAGEEITNSQFIKSYTPPSNVDANYWYLDFGAQFTK
ncbi:hypothetical protein HK098_000159 [Nowakowskiella sp. JEL0407]|nr:hypothetical protein HK098_000159 [Nowakowskiella sp. JEL0407]